MHGGVVEVYGFVDYHAAVSESHAVRQASIFISIMTVSVAVSTARGADFLVTNTNSSGFGSLHQAITDANNLPGPDRIVFNIPGAGLHKIDVSDNFLPTITDALVIDGYTQPGTGANTSTTQDNANVLIQIDGGYAVTTYPTYSAPTGIEIAAPDCMVRGLMITRFAVFRYGLGGGGRQGGFGVAVRGERCVIEGNLVGTDGTADTTLGNQEAGILVAASGAQIGGNTPAARNVVGGNAIGVWVAASQQGFANIGVPGNQIGTNAGAANNESAPNDIGVVLSGVMTNVIVGGPDTSMMNLIAGNRIGIRTAYTNPGTQQTTFGTGTVIEGNWVGLQPNRGASAAINQHVGIEVLGSGHMIGGLAAGAANHIAFNDVGIAVGAGDNSAVNNSIFSNEIYANSELGIDLGEDGATSNDLGDADEGPNHLQNFPVLSSVQQTENGKIITGTLNSTPAATFTVQIFEDLGPHGQALLATQSVTTDKTGNAQFSVSAADSGTAGQGETATATDADGNTSEFMPQNGPVQLANISTRGFVGSGEGLLIGGFIVRGDQPKKVGIRALGPSSNVPAPLADPYLELYDSNGKLLAKNDDWRSGQQQEVTDAGLAPASDVESALIATLPPGNYTAQVRGADSGSGNGIVEVYDLDPFPAAAGRLANISTRGFVGTNDNVLIGGTIMRGDAADNIVIRAIGPDLAEAGVASPLQDPTLELRDASGNLVAENDDWRQGSAPIPPALDPGDDRDAAINTILAPGAYTAIVRGKNDGTGLALVEFYDLQGQSAD
jgi:hypothetical protein